MIEYFTHLQPCPLCNSHDVALNYNEGWDTAAAAVTIVCFDCGCQVQDSTDIDAVDKWNTRVLLTHIEDIVRNPTGLMEGYTPDDGIVNGVINVFNSIEMIATETPNQPPLPPPKRIINEDVKIPSLKDVMHWLTRDMNI